MRNLSQKLKVGMLSMMLAIVIAIGGVVGGMTQASAATATFTLSPMSQRIILIPGETYRGSIRLSNPTNSDSAFHYAVTVSPYSVKAGEGSKDDYGDMDFSTVSNRNEMMNWIEIDNPKGVIPVNEHVTVTFSVNVPSDAPAGGQYATLMITEDTSERTTSANSATITEIMQMAHIIYAEVAGETRETGKIIENNIPSFLFDNKLDATSMVRNDGNVHTDAEYIFQVWPMFSDEEICTNEESVKTSLVMPETERYHTETCNLPAVGLFRAKQTVKIFGEESIVEKTVIVCPLWLIFVILFVIIALVIWIIIKVRSHGKAKSRASAE